MAKELGMTERQALAAKLLADLRARRAEGPMTTDEMLAFAARMPGMPEGWSSAESIREFRGPLPEDDSDLQTHDDRR